MAGEVKVNKSPFFEAFIIVGRECATTGYKSTAEIDEAIESLNLALA
jgi:hypothetical protein